jgi:hypothetical protein
MRNIAGLHTKVKIYSRLHIGGHRGLMANLHFKFITTISGEFPVLIGGPQVPTPLVV